jgi:hypothetical protein
VETRNHYKNGAELKSLMSRRDVKLIKMKKILTIFLPLLWVTIVVTSCNSSSEKNAVNTVADTLKVSTDRIKDTTATIIEEVEKLEPANVSCKLFFKGSEITDEETGETTKATIDERSTFRKEHAYTFCYDSEDFHHLTLIGSGKELSFIIKKGNKQVFKKENFELIDELTFTSKDFSLDMGEPYSVVIKQNETILFTGKIDSQGCM